MEMYKVCSLTLKLLTVPSEHAAALPKYTCTHVFITEDDIRWPHVEVMNWRDEGH